MDNNNPQKAKLERFKAMGIPVPMEKPNLDQPIVNVKDPKMLARIQEIKNGAKKGEFNAIISSSNKNPNFNPLPEPKTKTPGKQDSNKIAPPKLDSFSPAVNSPELALAQSLFEDTPKTYAPTSAPNRSGQRIVESQNSDSMGTDFLSDFRAKMQAKAANGGIRTAKNSSGFGFREQQQEKQHQQVNEIQSLVESVASQVAKKVAADTIKTVLDEYLSKRASLNESQNNTYKKVKDDIVMIEGKYYKLVPVKVKSKQ